MNQSFWLLVPWLVFAVAMGLKARKVTQVIRGQVRRSAWGVERFRGQLERHWQRSELLG